MKITYECLSCLTKQVIKVATISTDDISMQQKIIKKLFSELSALTFEESSPYIGWKINKYINKELNILDPYKQIKDNCNQLAVNLCEEFKLQDLIDNSDFPAETACRMAIAGNIIDFSAHDYISEGEIRKTIQRCLDDTLYGDKIENLMEHVKNSKKILYLADNSGEIVFDMLFINQLPKEKITYVVKNGPIVNDATMQDAIDIKMNELVRVIDNGSDAQGTILELCSDNFKKEFNSADLIIAKGQANFETLNYIKDKNIFYLFKAKCMPVAKYINCNVGDLVMKKIR